jgi:uncharacterized membrane protein YraQ (UPF0718 family)
MRQNCTGAIVVGWQPALIRALACFLVSGVVGLFIKEYVRVRRFRIENQNHVPLLRRDFKRR